ncbi:MAG: Uma2 family endonuclease [Chloroflexota bacterium]
MQSTQTAFFDDVEEKVIPNAVMREKLSTKSKDRISESSIHLSGAERKRLKNGRWLNGASRRYNDEIDLDSPELDSLEEGDTLDGLKVSLEDYWSKIYNKTERFYEWNNGILEEKPRMAQLRKYWICKWFLQLLYDYLYVNPIATIIESDMGFEFPLASGGTQVRGPDIGIVLNTNPVQLGEWEYSYQGIFDLCIELISDSRGEHITRDTQDKRTEYAHAGVTEYFILDDSRPPRPNETAFYRLNANGIYQPIQPVNGIIVCSVLPEFQFRREHLFTQPDLITLLDDPVYQGYILPYVRAERLETERERQRTEEERQRTEEERQRTEEERQRAEELAQALAVERALNAENLVYTDRLHAYLASIGVDLPSDLR